MAVNPEQTLAEEYEALFTAREIDLATKQTLEDSIAAQNQAVDAKLQEMKGVITTQGTKVFKVGTLAVVVANDSDGFQVTVTKVEPAVI